MRRKILSVIIAIVLVCSVSSTLLACKDKKQSADGATLTGLYVTGDEDATIFEKSTYTVYNHGSTTAATDANSGVGVVNADSSFKVTKDASKQTYESVFWRVTNWDVDKHLQFTVTVKNNLTTPVNVRILLASVDGVGSDLGPTNIHHGDGYASDTNYTLGGGATRTYRVYQDPEALYDIVSGVEKEIKAVYMRFNTHGTMLGAADVTISKMTLAAPTNVFDIGDFAPLYGSSYHKVLNSNYNESAKTLSSALYMGATGAYDEDNWGFDSQTSAFNEDTHRYLHYKLVNKEDANTNLDTYGVTLLPVSGTGSSADTLGDAVTLGFTENNQTLTGVIDLDDYVGFTTIRLSINDHESNTEYNVETPDGTYVAIEAHIMYSSSETASFGTLPTLAYTVPEMPGPEVITEETGDLTDQISATAASITDKVTVTLVSQDVVEVDGRETVITSGGVVNKFVVVANYTSTASFNPALDKYSEFAGVDIDLREFAERGLLPTNGLGVQWRFTNVSGDTIGFASRFVSSTTGDQSPGSPRGELAAGASSTREAAIVGNGDYFNLTNFKMYLGTASETPLSGQVKVEIWFNVPPPNETLATPVISVDATDTSGRTVKWTAVEKATGYDVYVGTTRVGKVTTTSYKLTATEEGTYKVTIKAVGNGSWLKDSASSNEISIVIAFAANAVALNAPVIAIDSSDSKTVTWSADANATGFDVYVDDVKVVENGAATSYTLTQTALGEYDIKVKAIGDGTEYKNSVFSNVVTIEIIDQGAPVVTFDWNEASYTRTSTAGVDNYSFAAGTVNPNTGKQIKYNVTNHTAKFTNFEVTVTNKNDVDSAYLRITLCGADHAGGSGLNGSWGQDFVVEAGATLTLKTNVTTANADKAVVLIMIEFNSYYSDIPSGLAGNLDVSNLTFKAPTTFSAATSNNSGDVTTATALAGSTNGATVEWTAAVTKSNYKGITWTIGNFNTDFNRIKITMANIEHEGTVFEFQTKVTYIDANGDSKDSYSGWKTGINGDSYVEFPNNVTVVSVELCLNSDATEGSFDITYFGFYTHVA